MALNDADFHSGSKLQPPSNRIAAREDTLVTDTAQITVTVTAGAWV